MDPCSCSCSYSYSYSYAYSFDPTPQYSDPTDLAFALLVFYAAAIPLFLPLVQFFQLRARWALLDIGGFHAAMSAPVPGTPLRFRLVLSETERRLVGGMRAALAQWSPRIPVVRRLAVERVPSRQ